jgi:ribose 5-phosphate isomerase A
MFNYKKQSAEKAFQFIKSGQTIGLGEGTTVLYLADFITADTAFAASLTITSSSAKTITRLKELGLDVKQLSDLKAVDSYYDGCDQFDSELNALKSGAGIHTLEKTLAGMAKEFVLIGDSDKFSEKLTAQYPIVVELIPYAFSSVMEKLKAAFPEARFNLRQQDTGNPSITVNGNYLLDLKFEQLPELSFLNTFIKMMPGVIDHSLFFRIASKAIISGPDGTTIIVPSF